MKSLLFLAFFSLLIAVDGQVPQAVQERFAKMFPKAEEVRWSVQDERHVATFKHYRSLKKALFAQDGNWLETHIQRPLWSCPDPVIAYVELNHKEAAVTAAAKVILEEDRFYRVEVEYPEKVVVLDLNEGGYLLDEQVIPFTFELDF